MDIDNSQERMLRRREAAKFIQDTWNIPCSVGTLAKYAVNGQGPAFQKAGNVPLYPESSIREWALKRLSPLVRSTSELQNAEAA